MSTEKHTLHSVVALKVASGRWPAGTEGTVVETFEDGAMVELVDERGHTLDLLSLPYDVLEKGDRMEPVTPPSRYMLGEDQSIEDVLAVEAELLRSEGIDPAWPGFDSGPRKKRSQTS